MSARSIAINLILIVIALTEAPAKVYADEGQPREIDNHYRQHRTHSRSLFKTLPGTHFSPESDSIMLGQSIEYIDASINGQNTSSFGDPTHFHESLSLQGFSLAPSATVAGKHFGLGVSGALGKRSSSYHDTQIGYYEKSKMNMYGAGTHLIWNPIVENKTAKLSFTIGIKRLNVIHQTQAGIEADTTDATTWERIDYEVMQGYIGTHLQLQVFKQLFLIPWVNQSYTDSSSLTKAANKARHKERVSGDQEVFLAPGSTLSYGLDIGVVIKDVRLNIGNLIGFALANEDVSSQRVKDRSFNLNISAEFN